MGCKMPWWAGSETPPPDKDKMIADLRAELASLKEQNSAVTLASAHLINQLAAAKGRVERILGFLESCNIEVDQVSADGRYVEREALMKMAPEDKAAEWTIKFYAPYGLNEEEDDLETAIISALSDLPEADKEKS